MVVPPSLTVHYFLYKTFKLYSLKNCPHINFYPPHTHESIIASSNSSYLQLYFML